MKLKDIPVDDVLAGGNWILLSGDPHLNPEVRETIGYNPKDVGLFSAVAKFADGSDHPALVVRSFAHDGEDMEIFVHTAKLGWLNLQEDGFHRAIGKYHNEVFPFDYFLANPWDGVGKAPSPELNSPHPRVFRETAVRMRQKPEPKE